MKNSNKKVVNSELIIGCSHTKYPGCSCTKNARYDYIKF